jgi:hypothetical protein
MIAYIEYGPIMTAEAPIVCEGADLYVFAVPADLKALNHLCKRVFDHPSGGAVKCRALDAYVILIFGAIKKVSGVVGGPGVKEKNVLLHVPVLVETADATFPALFSPFVWVDNPNSMTGGREVFGYAKTFGTIEINSPPEPAAFGLDTFGGNFTDQFWDMHPGLIRVERKQKIADPLFSIMDLAGGLGEVGYLLESWSGEGVAEIFHKQFRAITDREKGKPAPACLHEIATADYGLFGPAAEIDPLTNLYELKVKHLDSHPVVKELGLPLTRELPGYRVRTSFRVEHGRVLWHG